MSVSTEAFESIRPVEPHDAPLNIIQVPGLDDVWQDLLADRINYDEFYNIARVPGVMDVDAGNRLELFARRKAEDRKPGEHDPLAPFYSEDGRQIVIRDHDGFKRFRGVLFALPVRLLDFVQGALASSRAPNGPWVIALRHPYPFGVEPHRGRLSFSVTLALVLQMSCFRLVEQPTVDQLEITCNNVPEELKIFPDPVVEGNDYVTFFQDARHDGSRTARLYRYYAPGQPVVCANCNAFSRGRTCHVQPQLLALSQQPWRGQAYRNANDILDRPSREANKEEEEKSGEKKVDERKRTWAGAGFAELPSPSKTLADRHLGWYEQRDL